MLFLSFQKILNVWLTFSHAKTGHNIILIFNLMLLILCFETHFHMYEVGGGGESKLVSQTVSSRLIREVERQQTRPRIQLVGLFFHRNQQCLVCLMSHVLQTLSLPLLRGVSFESHLTLKKEKVKTFCSKFNLMLQKYTSHGYIKVLPPDRIPPL